MRTWLLALVAWLALLGAATAQDVLGGRYFGIDEAEGLLLEIQPDEEGFTGTLADGTGAEQAFDADNVGGSAETVVDLAGRPAFLRISPVPVGVSVAWTPIDADGVMLAGETRILAFLREGTVLPDLPEFYVDPPTRPGALVSGNSFLLSYEFWPPDGVVRGFQALPAKYRALMRMFPLVQLDVIWKLCLSPAGAEAQARALRGQGLSCAQVTAQFEAMQRDDRFARFKQDLAAEKDVFIAVVRCADAYPMTRQECDTASQRLAARAVSLETASSALARYR